jgi:predicted N-formylglutamate amidohydrolase
MLRTNPESAAHLTDAAEVLPGGHRNSPLFLTCEHASNRVPPPLRASTEDDPWLRTHWAWDIGAAQVTRALAQVTGSPAVLSRFSRLVCDPNRLPTDHTWIRDRVEGHPISFNAGLTSAERRRRLVSYHHAFHQTLGDAIAARMLEERPPWLLSIHSFTARYQGERRAMDIGVLFDDYVAPAVELARRLRSGGLETALNEPYSGLRGLIYSANRHGRCFGLPYLELEIRNDLIDTPEGVERITGSLLAALAGFDVEPHWI